MNNAAWVVADEMNAGRRRASAAAAGTAIVSVPVAAGVVCGIVAAGAGGVLLPPACEHAVSATAANRD